MSGFTAFCVDVIHKTVACTATVDIALAGITIHIYSSGTAVENLGGRLIHYHRIRQLHHGHDRGETNAQDGVMMASGMDWSVSRTRVPCATVRTNTHTVRPRNTARYVVQSASFLAAEYGEGATLTALEWIFNDNSDRLAETSGFVEIISCLTS